MSEHWRDQVVDGFRCLCGEVVAVPHQGCLALLTPAQRRRWSNGKPIGMDDD